MNRLRLGNRRAPAPAAPVAPFESDRDSLAFPEGGVFGSPAPAPNDIADDIQHTLSRVQAHLDQLRDDVENVFHLPDPSTSPWSPPSAA